jgi:uncharacterized protein with von Willebrand factor type A (vWA) domain
MQSAGTGALVEPLVAFGRELRRRGLDVGPGRVESAVRAVACVDGRNMDETYWALRCALLSRREDAEAFDEAFAAFWRGMPVPGMRLEQALPQRSAPELRDPGPGGSDRAVEPGSVALSADADDDAHESPADEEIGARFSPIERLREMDFREWGPDELAAARAHLDRIARTLPRRRSRRRRAGSRGPLIDRRSTLRHAMRTEGHPLELRRLERRTAPRRMLLLVDVSGSMEAYARPLIIFCQAVRQASSRVEAFAFGTRLTRLTRELGERDPERAMQCAAAAVPDWAGGTRIGDNLRTLNAAWGRRGVTRGAVVIVFSDGWERGDVSLLDREMERLHRAARTVVWVNPLAGEPGYEPLAAGMAAALPHVDHFLPGHDLASLERLVEVLDVLDERDRDRPVHARLAPPERGVHRGPLRAER